MAADVRDHSRYGTSGGRGGQGDLLASGNGNDDSASASTPDQGHGENSIARSFISIEEALLPAFPASDAFPEDTSESWGSAGITTPPRTEDAVELDVGTNDAVNADEGIIYVTAPESDDEEVMRTISRASSANPQA
jgi:hypothetical protein